MGNRQIVGSFAVVFNDQGKVLLGQRNEPDPTNEFHQKWNFPGGGVDFGEDPKETAVRETMEETGVSIAIVNNTPVVFSQTKESNQYILLYYLAKYKKGEITVEKDHGTSDAKWFEVNSIDFTECLPNLENILKQLQQN